MKVRKREIDIEVARQLGKTKKSVSRITRVFLHEVMKELVNLNVVHLEGFGELEVMVYKCDKETTLQPHGVPMKLRTKKKYRVSFRKTAPFTRAIRARYGGAQRVEETMEKYGVDEQGTEQEKVAQKGCPNCGGAVEKHGNVLACPKCGTEPFETANKKK